MNEFNLSEKRSIRAGKSRNGAVIIYKEEDVKEFIRLLKEKMLFSNCNDCMTSNFNDIDNLAGEKINGQ